MAKLPNTTADAGVLSLLALISAVLLDRIKNKDGKQQQKEQPFVIQQPKHLFFGG